MTTMKIAEDGKNGTVEITHNSLVRITKSMFGKEDREMIPLRSIVSVQHNRKKLGADIVTLTTVAGQYVWKVTKNAEGFVNELNFLILEG